MTLRTHVTIETSFAIFDFLTKLFLSYAEDLGLPYFTHECVPGKPIMIMTWEGEDPSLSSVILNSHTDVVPVFPEVKTGYDYLYETKIIFDYHCVKEQFRNMKIIYP